ncbi:MAG TPA: ANTAR domain-containing protein [Acidimicrobiales bacterium]|nr:ANTAR domain-containing protein [Acidimicrobiales bacterium]
MSDSPLAGLENGREALRRFLAGEDDLNGMLTKITLMATETVPGCDLASITLLRRGEPRTPVFTGKTALALDETQYRFGYGPCLAAISQRGVECVDVATDTRWPAFADAASEAGVRACLSVPLADDHTVLGALNLYSTTDTGFDENAREVACLFADQLGLAAANATAYAEAYELAQQLQQAMESRAVIEQAKGILMAAQGCDADEAFQILVRASQNQNRKLRAVATEIVARRAKRDTD